MLRATTVTVAIAITVGCGAGEPPALVEPSRKFATVGTIERIQPGFDQVVPSDAEIRLLVDGHEWTEGPVWVPELDSFLYSEIPSNAIHRWSSTDGASLWLQPSGYTGDVPRAGEKGSNGLTLGLDGSLLIAQHGDRRIAKLEAGWSNPEPRFTTLADSYQGQRLSSPNDLVVRSNGDIYFTDPPYGLEQRDEDPLKELDVDGVYRLSPDGSVGLVVSDLRRPNGVALSPDENTLYVSAVGVIMAYDILADGTLAVSRLFHDGGADGLAVDQQGRLYAAASRRGVLVLDSDGLHLGSIIPGDRVSNVTFGEEGSTLFITGVQVVSIHLRSKGVGF